MKRAHDRKTCRNFTLHRVHVLEDQELLPLPAIVSYATCGSEERTVHDGTFYLGLKRPLYSESGLPMLGVA